MDWWNRLLDRLFGTDEPDADVKTEEDFQPPEHDDAFYISQFVRNKIEDAGGDPEEALATHNELPQEGPLGRPATEDDIRLQAYLDWETDCRHENPVGDAEHYWYKAEAYLNLSPRLSALGTHTDLAMRQLYDVANARTDQVQQVIEKKH